MPMRVLGMKYGGDGLGEDGSELSYTLPGELVEEVDGELPRVLEASLERVAARCRHFGRCGGCQYQHAGYPAQVELKRAILGEILATPEIEVVTGAPWGYRNRVRLRVEVVQGVAQVGYNRRGSNEFLPIEECPIAAPVIWRTAAALMENGQKILKNVAEVELFCAADETRVQISLTVRAPIAADQFESVFRRVQAAVPELAGAGAELSDEAGRRSRLAWRGAFCGAPGLTYEAAGLKYWISRGSFFQVNRFLIDDLVRLVAGGRAGSLVWDLFAGVGLFSRVLARNFLSVVAVEGSAVAAGDLMQAGANVRAVHSDTLRFLRRAVLERDRPELVVMDPPRAGIGREACELLGRVGAAAMVYVSCDPVTLARDLSTLTRLGYATEQVTMVDMFPQTFHIETVVVLRRQSRAAEV